MKLNRIFARNFLAAMMIMAAGSYLHAAEINCGKVVVFTDRGIYIAGEQILFTLKITGTDNGSGSITGEVAYLLLRDSHQGQVAKVCMKTVGGTAYGSITMPDTLSTGYYQLVAFTNRMRNCGEDCYFTKELIIANLFDRELTALSPGNSLKETEESPAVKIPAQHNNQDALNIKGLKASYARGEEINFSFSQGSGETGQPDAFTVSVAEEEPWQRKISGYGSEQSCLKTSTSQAEFLPETKGQIITGKVTDRASGTGMENCCVLLSAKDTAVNLQYAYTGSNGIFRFRLSDYYQQKNILIQLMDTVLSQKATITIEDKFALKSDYRPSISGITPAVAEYIRNSQDIVRVQRIYGQLPETVVTKQNADNASRPALYYKPDLQVFPGEYEPLGDFAEITKELLPTVRIRKTEKGIALELTDKVQQGFFNESAAIFIDGIYQHDNGRLLPMGSDRIRSIEVVNTPRVYGSLTFSGILAVFTNDSAATTITDRSSRVFRTEPYSGNTVLQQQELPRNTTLPDFRQLLCWQPAVQPGGSEGAEIKFCASQHTGTFIISVRGTNANGEIIQENYRFTIR
jgi:hypothetical protein